MSTKFKSTSPYYLTPVTDWHLDLYVPRKVAKGDYDNLVIIPPEFDQRPDLMSYREYGTPKLWWVFSVRNPDRLIDPIEDFRSGLEIYIPANILKA